MKRSREACVQPAPTRAVVPRYSRCRESGLQGCGRSLAQGRPLFSPIRHPSVSTGRTEGLGSAPGVPLLRLRRERRRWAGELILSLSRFHVPRCVSDGSLERDTLRMLAQVLRRRAARGGRRLVHENTSTFLHRGCLTPMRRVWVARTGRKGAPFRHPSTPLAWKTLDT